MTETIHVTPAQQRVYLLLLFEVLNYDHDRLVDMLFGDDGIIDWDRFVEDVYIDAAVAHGLDWDELEDDKSDPIGATVERFQELFESDDRLSELIERFEEKRSDSEDTGPIPTKALLKRVRKLAKDELLLIVP